MKKGRTLGWLMTALFIGLMVVALALFGSCTTERVVTVEKVRTDTVRENRTVRDSIHIHDSTLVKEKGDTVWIERWHTKRVSHLERDTIYKATHDTVPRPYPVIKEVEKPLTKTEKGLMGVGILTLMGLIVFIAWKLKRFLP